MPKPLYRAALAAMLLILAFCICGRKQPWRTSPPADRVPEALARVLWGSLAPSGSSWPIAWTIRWEKKTQFMEDPHHGRHLGRRCFRPPSPARPAFSKGPNSRFRRCRSTTRDSASCADGRRGKLPWRRSRGFLESLSDHDRRPVVLFTEISGFQYPGLDADRPFWEQAYPLYGLLVFALSLPALPRGRINAERTDGGERLTDRERRVIELLRRGRSYKAIASELDIGVPTVKSHATNAYRKLGIRNRKELYSRYPS